MEREVSTQEYLEEQLALERAARKKFPWDPSECTLHMDIPPRQLLFACLTCSKPNAICYACGLRCHSDHELVELYTKRGFECDCGSKTRRCALRKRAAGQTNENRNYGHNFWGRFCVCEESVHSESYGHGAMFQCLLGTRCNEDWFHARCILGITREEEVARQSQERSDEYEEDSDSGDDMAIFPGFPSEFGALICPACSQDVSQIVNGAAVLTRINGYIFLKENYGEIFTAEYPELVRRFPFLDGNEESYTPERDTDDTTMFEAGLQALEELPHGMVIDGLEKFNSMKDGLIRYLREVGSDGHSITREDIEDFFDRTM